MPDFPEEYEEIEAACDHCGWEGQDDRGWFHTLPQSSYGIGPQSEGSVVLCGFCYRSQMVSAWLVGLNRPNGDLAKDLLAGLNLLRRELMPEGPLDL